MAACSLVNCCAARCLSSGWRRHSNINLLQIYLYCILSCVSYKTGLRKIKKMWIGSLERDTCQLNHSVITLDCGRIPKALFSARWLKCSSVLGEKKREARSWDQQVSLWHWNADSSGFLNLKWISLSFDLVYPQYLSFVMQMIIIQKSEQRSVYYWVLVLWGIMNGGRREWFC